MATKTQTINLRVGPRLKEAIEDAARENEMTVGEFVRTIMAQYLSVYEVGLRAHPSDADAIPKRAAEPWIPKSEDDCIDGAPCEHDPPCAQTAARDP